MVFIGERCLNLHRITLSLLGLWPYQKPSVLRTVFFFGIFFASLVFQLTVFITTKYDTEFIITELTRFCPFVIYFLNYNCFYFNSKSIKQLLEHIKLDWKIMEDSEMKIIKKYSYIGYFFSFSVNILLTLVMLIFTIIEFIPIILDAIAPLNESRPHRFKVSYELFIDEEEYYFLYLIVEVVTVTIGIYSTVMTGTFLLTIGGHFCATFKIASNLIKETVTENMIQMPAPYKIYFMYRNICRAVHIHRRTVQIISNMSNSLTIWYLPLLLFGVISSSCIIFRFLNAIRRLNDLSELFVSFSLFMAHFIYMFIANLGGQVITDHSSEMLKSVYNTLWYVAPLSIQKLILFLLTSVKDYKLLVGGIFVPSFEGFSTLITSAISYFTVIYTMRE
ncbi:odorant receptor 24a-like [Solenopsis invicta]|uniref:odorant receptor 24a-like n=1 Tax=Solenopsis invicta TaxID=13686 RepID=UPI00193D0DF9|nr:odorant receptor 24a-like [Solenopsis invicta]